MANLDNDNGVKSNDDFDEGRDLSERQDNQSSTENPHVSRDETDHVEAMARYDRGWTKDRANIERSYADLNFLAGYQWDPTLAQQRSDDGRPVLTFNRMGQFVRQVTGDMRQMKPAIKVVPTHSGADEAIAEIREGLIRHIENASNAALDVYVDGADSQVAAGIGHWEVASEYNMLGEQDLTLRTIDDQISVIWDPDARKKTREDGVFCFVPVNMTREAFKTEYPDRAVEDMGSWHSQYLENWYDDDRIMVCRYWYKVAKKIAYVKMPDGSIHRKDDLEEDDADTMMEHGGKDFEVDGFEVFWRMMNGVEFLTEPKKWPGQYIPIIPAIGEEIKVGARRERHGIVRFAADPQRAYNYARSTQTEFVGLQPKSPFVGTEENFKDYDEEWNTANVKNWPFLRYTPDPKNGNAAPQRQSPPGSSPGLSECIADAAADMQAVVGIYNASLGAKSNETSGIAIANREKQGDTGTYVYMANFALAITHTARVINDLIPYFYDTARTIRILGQDGKSKQVKINQPAQPITIEGVAPDIINDVTVGIYDVQMEMGPSYQTQREEARDGMGEFIKAFPAAAPLIADMIANAQDWPQKDEVAKRLQTLLPPPIQAELAQSEGKPPPPPPPPDPVKMAEAQGVVAKSSAEVSRSKAEATKAETSAVIAQMDVQKKQMELAGQQLSNMKLEMELLALQAQIGQNGPPIDQAKLHEFVRGADEALKFLSAHVAAQIGAEPSPMPQEQGAATPAPEQPQGAPQASAGPQEAGPEPSAEPQQSNPSNPLASPAGNGE